MGTGAHPRRFVYLTAVVLLAGVCAACGGADREASNTGGTEGTDEVAAQGDRSGTLDCSAFPMDLIVQVAQGYSQVPHLTSENISRMRDALSVPDPSSFRTFADAFEQLDTTGIEPFRFDAPTTTAEGQRRLADLLEHALAMPDDAGGTAWSEFRTFVAENATRQQLSVNYYMGEAGCV